MIDLSIDISKLPTIPEKNSWETFVTGMEEKYTDCGITLRLWWRYYRSWIIFGLFLLIVTIVIVLILVLKPNTQSYPCLSYQPNTLASSVSVDCLQYIWNANCKISYTFPSGYTGWCNQSPQGTTMVACRGTMPCGVGSYGNIALYLTFCQIGFKQ
jgi:hypothetical protein